jgi:hypothetical protein
MEDKTIKCKECGDDFVLTVDDQKWYQEKGFKEPKRCKSCRHLRRENVIGKEHNYGEKKSEHTRRKF